ncbi:hypothetical protein [Spiroplasma phoeniceum]|uniref:hypothetical protein n=1 Tax=Spiroplasma phoeniceum TaxID=47835 RepID=UPI000DF8013E|nr:hypothetical protein [Spiroplasma phoeniceum]
MARKIIDVQLVTYKKRILYQPNIQNENWFWIFLKMLRFQFVAISLGVLTGGLGAAVAQGLNATQLTISTTRIAISSLSNFLVMEFNDIIK